MTPHLSQSQSQFLHSLRDTIHCQGSSELKSFNLVAFPSPLPFLSIRLPPFRPPAHSIANLSFLAHFMHRQCSYGAIDPKKASFPSVEWREESGRMMMGAIWEECQRRTPAPAAFLAEALRRTEAHTMAERKREEVHIRAHICCRPQSSVQAEKKEAGRANESYMTSNWVTV